VFDHITKDEFIAALVTMEKISAQSILQTLGQIVRSEDDSAKAKKAESIWNYFVSGVEREPEEPPQQRGPFGYPFEAHTGGWNS
jgi:hypothetical protein